MFATLALALALAPADLVVDVLKEGTGTPSAEGDVITVTYKGTLTDGKVFDETGKNRGPFAFRLGDGSVIKGWDQGLVGRRVGERLTLTVPPTLGYGSKTQGEIPPDSTLKFDVSVLRIDRKGAKPKVQIEEIEGGSGRVAKKGDTVTIHYKGTFLNGHKFDASYDRKEPFEFVLGEGRVIRGFDEGVTGMKAGGTRRITIPFDLAYGEKGRPPVIPRMSTLVFEMELLTVL